MATYDWPSGLRPSSMTMTLVSNTRVFTSKYSGAVQTARTPGSRWKISLSFDRLNDDESRILEALRTALDGSSGRVKCWDFGREPFVVGGTPKVAAANQMGDTLLTNGWPADTIVLRAGDYFSINGEYKQVTADAVSGSTGAATIQFGPALRSAPAIGALLNVSSPSSLFYQTEAESGFERQPAFVNGFVLNLMEDVL